MNHSQARQEYTQRLEARRSAVLRHEQRHHQIGYLRLLTFAAGAAIAWLALGRDAFSPLWLIAPMVVFVALIIRHEAVLTAQKACRRAVAHYEKALARMEGKWAGMGETGERFLDPGHPYAEDLDLFGKGSLFELLCTARTRRGEEVLAHWLLNASAPDIVQARHRAVEELRPMLDLREDLAVLGEDVRTGVHPEALAAWGEEPPLLTSAKMRLAVILIPWLLAVSALVWAIWGQRDVFILVFAVEAILMLRLRRVVEHVIEAVEQPAHDLSLLSQVLARLERENFTSPRLAQLRRELNVEGQPPSQRVARLARLVELLESRDHLLMRVLGPLMMFSEQLAFAVESWRRTSGPAVRRWLDAVGEMEALCALAAYSYEHPADPLPEFAPDGACFEGDDLVHPLLDESRAIRNSVRLGGDLRALIVSGSNMSGKSTLLRTAGVNAVLAQAGAPVRATRLRLSPLRLGASIRTMDSLQGGTSRFYAEIKRLHQIMQLAAGSSTLFLLDELLHGTNSHDRRIGGEAIVRGLVERGAIGLMTTHDLALAHIAESLAPRAANVHFEDHLENGQMTFDYHLRPGVVEKSNALELMRSVGLEV